MRERGDAGMVEVGYLNYSEPSFRGRLRQMRPAGMWRITIVPYFLVAGKFVTVDLAPKIEAMRTAHAAVEVRVADAMRFHPLLADAILACAERTAPPGAWREILQAAPQFCRADARCPLFGGPSCPATAGLNGAQSASAAVLAKDVMAEKVLT